MPASCMHGVGMVVWPGRRLLLRPVSGEMQPSSGSDPDPDPGSRWPHGTSQSAAPASSPRARLVQPPRAARADLPIARPSPTSLAPPPFPSPSPGRDARGRSRCFSTARRATGCRVAASPLAHSLTGRALPNGTRAPNATMAALRQCIELQQH